MTKILLEYIFGVSWSIYFGGALIMFIVWKPLQRYLPPGQTAIICQKMGEKYKWIGLSSLSVFGLSWIFLGLESFNHGSLGSLHFSFNLGEIIVSVVAVSLWGLLVSLVLFMGLKLHPSSHMKIPTKSFNSASFKSTSFDLDSFYISETKTKEIKKAAIKKMDLMLKLELLTSFSLSVILAVTNVVKV